MLSPSERNARGEEAMQAALAALKDARDVLKLIERPELKDPRNSSEIEALGERIGYGALMAGASALWREKLSVQQLAGGEFCAGPCRLTVTAALRNIEAAIAAAEVEAFSEARAENRK